LREHGGVSDSSPIRSAFDRKLNGNSFGDAFSLNVFLGIRKNLQSFNHVPTGVATPLSAKVNVMTEISMKAAMAMKGGITILWSPACRQAYMGVNKTGIGRSQ
jgi:hypothetical protein